MSLIAAPEVVIFRVTVKTYHTFHTQTLLDVLNKIYPRKWRCRVEIATSAWLWSTLRFMSNIYLRILYRGRIEAETTCTHDVNLMTSSNGNIFALLARSPVNTPTKASDAELWCFLWYAPWINGWVNIHLTSLLDWWDITNMD